MKKRQVPAEKTALAVVMAIGLAAALAVAGTIDGVFAKLPGDEIAGLAAFAGGFALLTYFADSQVRALVNGVIAALRDRFARRGGTRGRPGRIPTRFTS